MTTMFAVELIGDCHYVNGHDPELWWPLPKSYPHEAIKICNTCPIRTACRDEALAQPKARVVGSVRGGWWFQRLDRVHKHPADRLIPWKGNDQ